MVYLIYNLFAFLIEKAKKEAVINEIDNSKLNSRVLLKTLKSIFPTKAKQMSRVNSLTKEGTSYSTPEEISNVFNEHFTLGKKAHIRDRLCPNADRHTWSIR